MPTSKMKSMHKCVRNNTGNPTRGQTGFTTQSSNRKTNTTKGQANWSISHQSVIHCWEIVSELVSWHFELNQPQRITQLKTMFNLSPVYSACKSSNHKLSQNYKISPDTNLHITYTNIKHKNFKELVPSVSPLLKKAHKAWTRWYHGPFHRSINTRF